MDLRENHREENFESNLLSRPAWQESNLSQNKCFTGYPNLADKEKVKAFHWCNKKDKVPATEVKGFYYILTLITVFSGWIISSSYPITYQLAWSIVFLFLTSLAALIGFSLLIWWFIFIDWETIERDPIEVIRIV